ncbi:MAG: twin-arginine translocation signal domain-containing protein [Gammaproteobacteria bacterium]|nr:MAG: twin-arginine translocation signal domain-containing protein [Gammaproteobacteria bacterium]
MTEQRDRRGKNRREFLKDMTLAGGGLAASAVLPGAAMAAVEPDETKNEEAPEEGYRLTEHVARYYQSLKG